MDRTEGAPGLGTSVAAGEPQRRRDAPSREPSSPEQADAAKQPGQRQDAGEPSGQQPEHRQGRGRLPLILAAVLIIAAVGAVTYWYLTRNQEATDDAYTDGRAAIISPQVGGYVTELAVNDNQFVHQGDLLVQIDQRDYLAARGQAVGQLTAMEAQLDNARVALDKARTTYPAQLTQAQGQLEEARGRLYQADREYHRQHNIDQAATSQQSVDTSTANLQIAQGQVDQAAAQLRQAELVQQNVAQAEAEVKQLEGQVQQVHANLTQTEINLGYTRITAPHDGWVTRRNVEMGNYLQVGAQIMSIVEPEVWVTANYKEDELTRMRPGQKVTIHVDAYPQLRLVGHVDSIQLGSGAKFSAFPPENATGNFVKIVQRVPVKIVIDSGLDPKIPLPLGLSVEPTVIFE